MHARTLLLAGLTAGLTTMALAMAQPAAHAAPSTAAQPASAPVSHGPPIPGMCLYSEGAIVEGSRVGQSVIARLKVLKQQVDAELQPEADSINGEAKTLDSQRSTMAQAAFQTKQANLQQRAANLEQRAQLRGRELQATQAKQFQVIGAAVEPILRQLYEQKQCAVIFDRDGGAVRAANPAMDLTAQAVAALDQKLQALTFDREHLDAQSGAAPKS